MGTVQYGTRLAMFISGRSSVAPGPGDGARALRGPHQLTAQKTEFPGQRQQYGEGSEDYQEVSKTRGPQFLVPLSFFYPGLPQTLVKLRRWIVLR
jgi:hypothetical protein